MKKIIGIFALFIALGLTAQAQTTARGTYAFDKRVKEAAPGISIELTGSPEYIETVISQKFISYTNEKPKNMKKGLKMYEAVNYPTISAQTLNYYYKVEAAADKSNKSVVTFFLSPGNDNFLTPDKFPAEIEAAERMLQSMDKDVRVLQLKEMIAAQGKVVDKTLKVQEEFEKGMGSLQKEKEDLNKALVENEKAMEKNLSDQLKQKEAIAVEQEKLGTLMGELQELQK